VTEFFLLLLYYTHICTIFETFTLSVKEFVPLYHHVIGTLPIKVRTQPQ